MDASIILHIAISIKLDLSCIHTCTANHIHITLLVHNLDVARCSQSAINIYIVIYIVGCTSFIVSNQDIAIDSLTGLDRNVQSCVSGVAIAQGNVAIVRIKNHVVQLVEPAAQIHTVGISGASTGQGLQGVAHLERIAVGIFIAIVIGLINITQGQQIQILGIHGAALQQDIAIRIQEGLFCGCNGATIVDYIIFGI